MKTKFNPALLVAVALMLVGATSLIAQQAGPRAKVVPPRPQGPCDIYAQAEDSCAAAHSTTRALYASYNGPLYQVLRQSDGKTLDIDVVQPAGSMDGGGYADAAAQDKFCANTYCWITTIYDQSGHHNNLTQAPRGGFSGPALGGFNNLPLADMAPVTIMGHKVYGVFIEPGMGLRIDDAKGTAVDDQAEGQYWVINGLHFNNGCCFDYGNAEIDSRDDDNGTMETAYFGDATPWFHGSSRGPWVMTDQENNLVGCVNPDGSKLCNLPSITWRFVTAMAKGEPHHWTSMGGDAQQGALEVMFDGQRVNRTYDPMRKQGAILLGNGGDNSNGSQGTFYEGAMTAAGTFPTDATDQLVQANVVAAHYDVGRLRIAPESAMAAPPGLQIFAPVSSEDTTVTFTNTTGAPAAGVKLSLSLPSKQWTATVEGSTEASKTFAEPVAPGASVGATFKVTSGLAAFNGDLVGNASWTNQASGVEEWETATEKVRNVSQVRINEFRIASSAANSTDSFIELYNPGERDADISNWTLTEHPSQQGIFSQVKIPAGTRLKARGFYLLGLSNSGLAAAARAGDTTIYVRSAAGMKTGDAIDIDAGSRSETRKIASVGTAATRNTTLWQPLPEGPVITIPAGSTNVPVTSVAGFAVGEKIALGYGATYPAVARDLEKYEVATVTSVGKQGTQAYLAADAPAGSTSLKVTAVDNISVGDKIRLDIDSMGHGIETIKVTSVDKQASWTKGSIGLAAPLKFNHKANLPFGDRGTGISFAPATAFSHSSNEPVQALGTGITLSGVLASGHPVNSVVRDAEVTTAGYQGKPAPDQWFGGPELTTRTDLFGRPITIREGSMMLRDAAGLVVDSFNYGGLVDPWAAEGYQAVSGPEQNGCYVPAPASPVGFGPAAAGVTDRSAGRLTDGVDTGSNCADFATQAATFIPAATAVGATNIKVAGVAGFFAGQTITIDTGANLETVVIATVGTPGATTMSGATSAGAIVIPVSNGFGFSEGQTITIDSGPNIETAQVASVARFPAPKITLTAPLANAHAANAQVSGTGITLTVPLTQAHAGGVQVTDNLPTPGAPNKYSRKPQ